MHDGETVDLPTFWIARYPITHVQYAAFVQDGGYTARWHPCWSEEGWEWKSYRNWTGPRTHGGTYRLTNHPIVGVSHYEASAFCSWLGERLRAAGALNETLAPGERLEIALPSEAQWHKAAQGIDGRVYPWGDEPDPNRANVYETGIGATCAVGCFPGGISPYGVYDLCGNVWEWTASPDESAPSTFVLRGGSYWDNASGAWSGARDGSDSNSSDGDVGFRCACCITP